MIEADKLGQLRTGAASGVAAKFLARSGATTLGVLGCGWQAESQVQCIREAVPTIEHVVVYCRTEASLEEFCKRLAPRRARRTATPAARTSSSPRPPRDPSSAASGFAKARSSARSGRTMAVARARRRRPRAGCVRLLRLAAAVAAGRGDLIEPVEQGILDWLEVHEIHEVVALAPGTPVGRTSPSPSRTASPGTAIGAPRSRTGASEEVGRESRRRGSADSTTRRRGARDDLGPVEEPGAPAASCGSWMYGSSRMSASGRPRSCSRITYCAMRSSPTNG